MNFWEILKKLIPLLKMFGLDNRKIYDYLYPKVRDYVIKSIDLEDDKLEKKIEDLINGVIDLILRTLLDIPDDIFIALKK